MQAPVSIAEFVDSMRERRKQQSSPNYRPRFLFDVSVFSQCPRIMRNGSAVRLPGHVSTSFMQQWSDPWDQCAFPHFNLFLAEAGFKTELHTDSQHFSFTASMCTGRKRWRIIENSAYMQHQEQLGLGSPVSGSRVGRGGVKLSGGAAGGGNDALLLADVVAWQPLGANGTWNLTSILVTSPTLRVFEGILAPGEMLYIPGGAPHAAKTLENSLMFASNDGTTTSMKLLKRACRVIRREVAEAETMADTDKADAAHFKQLSELSYHCGDMDAESFEERHGHPPSVQVGYEPADHQSMQQNMARHSRSVLREAKSFAAAYRCYGRRFCAKLAEEHGSGQARQLGGCLEYNNDDDDEYAYDDDDYDDGYETGDQCAQNGDRG